MTNPKPMSRAEFAEFLLQVKETDARVTERVLASKSQREFLLRRQRLQERVAVARASDANRKQFDEENRQRAFKALRAKRTLRAKPAWAPPPPPTPYQQRGHDASRRKERDAKYESDLLDRKSKHDALPTAPKDRDNGPLLFTGSFGSTPMLVRPRRKQARWEKEQHFDQGVL